MIELTIKFNNKYVKTIKLMNLLRLTLLNVSQIVFEEICRKCFITLLLNSLIHFFLQNCYLILLTYHLIGLDVTHQVCPFYLNKKICFENLNCN
jgi:hypothetical protein